MGCSPEEGSRRADENFKDHLLYSQEWSIPMSRKSSKVGRKPAQEYLIKVYRYMMDK